MKPLSPHPSLAVLGSLTRDEIIWRGQRKIEPGGSSWFTSIAAASLGAKVDIISKIGLDYPRRDLAWLRRSSISTRRVKQIPGNTCRFELRYEGKSRRMRLLHPGAKLDPRALDRSWDAIHVGSVFREIPVSMIRDCKRRARIVSLDLQGFVRETNQSGSILLKPTRFSGTLGFVDLLKTTVEEALVQTSSSKIGLAVSKIMRRGPKQLLITQGRSGAILAERGGNGLKIPAYPEAEAVDPTGAGDAMVGGFLSTFVATGDVLWALSVGSAISSLLVRRSGRSRFRFSRTEVIKRACWVLDRAVPWAW